MVIACSITVTIAFRSADDDVRDNYVRDGRMITRDFAAQENARKLGLRADVRFDFDSQRAIVALNLPHEVNELQFWLLHPLVEEHDQKITLMKESSTIFVADLAQIFDAPASLSSVDHWYLRLVSIHEEKQWRLSGEIDFSSSHYIVLE